MIDSAPGFRAATICDCPSLSVTLPPETSLGSRGLASVPPGDPLGLVTRKVECS